jgi:tRNA-dihydrouridine synthase B
MNQITIIGNIGKDPELAFNSAGYPVCKFPVGTSYKKKTGEQETTWHNVVVFGEMGEHCAESLVKGTRVIVIGRPEKGSYSGRVEFDTVAAVKAAVKVPVVANGDIDSPERAQAVLAATGADAVMIGRAAQGRPWIFREITHFLATGQHLAPPLVAEVRQLLLEHLQDHYSLYGDYLGVRTARKHIAWYLKDLPGSDDFRDRMNLLDDCGQQLVAVAGYFERLNQQMDRLPAARAVVRPHQAPHRETTP